MTRDQLFKALENMGAKFDIGESFEGVQYISFYVNDMLDFGKRDDWGVIQNLASPNGYIILHKKWGYEFQDKGGDFLSFDTGEEARCYLNGFFEGMKS
jgi:hypothetical protein